MTYFWNPEKKKSDGLARLLKHEENCIRPLIKVCLLWQELQIITSAWENAGGIVLCREKIEEILAKATTAAAEVNKEANLAQMVQISEKVKTAI